MRQQSRKARARPFHRSGRIVIALILELVLWLLLAGCVGALGLVVRSGGEKIYGIAFFILLGACLVVFLAGRFYRGRIACPLCHGTILKTQPCRKHKNAHRIFFLTYKATTIFDIVTRLRFTCMYCGTRFRLRR